MTVYAWAGGASGSWDDANSWLDPRGDRGKGVPGSGDQVLISEQYGNGTSISIELGAGASLLSIDIDSDIQTLNLSSGSLSYQSGQISGGSVTLSDVTIEGTVTGDSLELAQTAVTGNVTGGDVTLTASTISINDTDGFFSTHGNLKVDENSSIIFNYDESQTFESSGGTAIIAGTLSGIASAVFNNSVLRLADTGSVIGGGLILSAEDNLLLGTVQLAGLPTGFVNSYTASTTVSGIVETEELRNSGSLTLHPAGHIDASHMVCEADSSSDIEGYLKVDNWTNSGQVRITDGGHAAVDSGMTTLA